MYRIQPVSLRSFKRFDNNVSLRLQEAAKSSWARRILAFVAHSADSVVVIPCLFALWWLDGFARQSLVIPIALGFAVSVVATSIIKLLVRRRRPVAEVELRPSLSISCTLLPLGL